MFHARDCKTGSLFDKWRHIGPKRRKLLDDSWAGLFRREILPELPVEKLAFAFHDSFGASDQGGAVLDQIRPPVVDEAAR